MTGWSRMVERGMIHRRLSRGLETILFINLAGKETTLYRLMVVVTTTGFTRAADLVMTISL